MSSISEEVPDEEYDTDLEVEDPERKAAIDTHHYNSNLIWRTAFYWYQIFTLDSVVVNAQKCSARMEAS